MTEPKQLNVNETAVLACQRSPKKELCVCDPCKTRRDIFGFNAGILAQETIRPLWAKIAVLEAELQQARLKLKLTEDYTVDTITQERDAAEALCKKYKTERAIIETDIEILIQDRDAWAEAADIRGDQCDRYREALEYYASLFVERAIASSPQDFGEKARAALDES